VSSMSAVLTSVWSSVLLVCSSVTSYVGTVSSTIGSMIDSTIGSTIDSTIGSTIDSTIGSTIDSTMSSMSLSSAGGDHNVIIISVTVVGGTLIISGVVTAILYLIKKYTGRDLTGISNLISYYVDGKTTTPTTSTDSPSTTVDIPM
jgi:hypothetical protein